MVGTIVLAVAAEGEASGLQLVLPAFAELLWGAVGFLILLALMFWKVFPALGRMLEQRQAQIQGQIEDAERQREEAEQLRRQYEERLADARSEAATIVEEARAQGERLRSDIVAKAEEEAEQIRGRARDDVEAERGRLVADLRGQVATLSVELASKIVQKELDEQRHHALVDQYINELSSLN